VVPGQRRPGQVVEAPAARLALVAPQIPIRPVIAAPDNLAAVAVRAVDALLPAQLPDGLVTLRFADQVFD